MSSIPSDDDRTAIRPVGARADAPTLASTPAAGPPSVSASGWNDIGNALPAGTYLGEFELLGVLGEGGFGIVYTAQDHSLQRRVALKEYMPSALAARTEGSQVQVRAERYRETFDIGLRSFVNEARLLAQFDHASLVKVYRFWEANGTAYMVMPLYEGITLKDKLKQMGTAPDEAWLMSILAALTEALAVIHAVSCFHRDIAPDNVILLAGSERPLLLDFGAARRVISDMTQALTVILKPGYAPVEQYAEVPEMKQGPWTDVYALAATMHYAIVGRTPPTSVGRLMNDTYEPLSVSAAGRYSARFLQAIDNALAVRPAERTASIDALRSELGLPPAARGDAPPPGPAQAAATTVVHQPPPASSAPALGGKGPVLAGVAALVLAAGVATAYLTTGPTKPATPAQPGPAVAVAPALPAPQAPVPQAPTPQTPTAQTPPAQKAFEIRDEFNKVMAGQVADYKVRAVPLQKSLRIGRDKLAFTVSSARDGFVHVLVLGPDGSLLLLFPNAQSSSNAIKAGQSLTLPQASWKLETAEPAGVEDFLVVVSAQPRDYSDLGKDREYIFLKLPTGQRGAELASRWSRSTPMLLGGLKSCPSADCEAYGADTFSVNVEH
jgi:serine/threonine protein kinase